MKPGRNITLFCRSGKSRRTSRLAHVGVAALICLGAVDGAHAQSLSREPSAVASKEFAEASVDRYTPPDPRHLLNQEGAAKSQALSQYYLGLSREKAGDIEGALDSFEKVLEVSPGQLRLAGKAADLAGQFGDSERGRKILETSFKSNRHLPAAYLRLSEYLWTYHNNQRSNRERALELVEDAAEQFPDNPSIYDRLITLHLAKKDRAKARETLTKALERSNSDPEFWLGMARVAQRLYPLQQQPVPVLINKIYEKALALGQGNPEVENRVADYYSLTRQFELARDLYITIIKERPEELIVREKLARVYSLLGQEDKVLETLVELEQINPHRLETQQFLARIYYDKENWSNSIKHYLKAFKISRGQPLEYRIVSTMMLWENRADEAVDLLMRAQFHYPEDLQLQVEMGVALNASDRYDEAFDLFRETEELAEQSQPELLTDGFYFSYGASAERLKKFQEAEKLFQKSIDLVPQNNAERAAMPYNYLGYMWLEQDMKIEEAGQLIIMANDLRPDSGAYVDSLGWYYFKKGDHDSAVETLLRAIKLMESQDPPEEDAVVYDHLAQAYFMQGNIKEAVNYAQKASKLEPDNKEMAERLKEYLAAKTASTQSDLEQPQPVVAPDPKTDVAAKELPNAA
tara:strand:- start:10085 stop:11986 length:1902 start_codon:yes stop_codon:yes gene_type:complete